MASDYTGGFAPDGPALAANPASASDIAPVSSATIAPAGPERLGDVNARENTHAEDRELSKPQVTILVCSDCRPPDGSDARPRPGELLAQAAQRANTHNGISIQTVACLGNCKRRLSASLVTQGCWSYVFGDLAIENARDLIDAALLMQGSQDGLMPWRGRPQCMKKGMVARIPPVASAPLVKQQKYNAGG